MRLRHLVLLLSFACAVLAVNSPTSYAQSGNFSSITAISTQDNLVGVPIFAISRTANVVTVSTIDPNNPDQFAQQSNQIGVMVTVANVTVDPSNAVNGTFPVCGPPTPGCITPTTSNWSFLSKGQNFSAASANQLGVTAVARVACPLIPNGYFSFCGDSRPGAGIAYPTDGSLMEIIATQDSVGTMLWASSLADGNTGSTRVTGCEQMFIESGNEWRLECDYMRRFGGSMDVDIKNNWIVLAVGDGLTTRGTGAEFAMNGPRKVFSFGILGNRSIEVDANANASAATLPDAGTLRTPNGGTFCWENAEKTNGLCETVGANDKFNFDGGVVSPTQGTTTVCVNFQNQCANAAAGFMVFTQNASSIFVSTTAVTAESQIFLQEDSSVGNSVGVACNTSIGRLYQIISRTPGVGFKVTASLAPVGSPACLSYHIVN